ncbi:MAG: tRNA uridine-5-carboxymethylaminomethyl(34) synthesis enzyme MnmG, partial [Actinobacteria bacterium]|nr:tRNA uridine-5-carboxymethylaminomethyl(34) synthesis enzyme MnmG [Actinomycetota bacterium]
LELPLENPVLPQEVREEVEIEVKYEGYIKKQRSQVERFEKLENRKIPADVDFAEMKGISNEARQKLARIRPESVGQAARVSGVSPADISVMLIYLEQMARAKGEDS